MSGVATFIKALAWQSDARLYRVSPPISHEDGSTEYVIVSGVDHEWATETYIFPADAEGKALDMLELEGSFKGAVDHELALHGAGYEVAA